MSLSLKIFGASISILGKEFIADAEGIAHFAENELSHYHAAIKQGIAKPKEQHDADVAAAAKAVEDAERAKVEAAAMEMLKEEDFRAKVLQRAAELVAAEATANPDDAAAKQAAADTQAAAADAAAKAAAKKK